MGVEGCLKFGSKNLVVYRVKCLAKIYGEHTDSHAVRIIKELAHFMWMGPKLDIVQ